MELAIKNGANVNFRGEEGMTALIWALLHGGKSGYANLLERGRMQTYNSAEFPWKGSALRRGLVPCRCRRASMMPNT